MRFQVVFLPAMALCLSACANTYWPGQNIKDGPLTAHDYPIIEQRYEAASKKSLGTIQDMAEIKQAIHISFPSDITEIRWISATEVIAYVETNEQANLGLETFYCALEKSNKGWRVVACYLDLIA